MAFQIKDFASITASMVNVMRRTTKRVTDFNVGSVVRTMLEAVGIEVDQLYQEMFHGLKEAIPVSTYTTFDFGLQPATPATGSLTFYAAGSNTSDVLIAAGTSAKNPATGKVYTTISDVILLVGQPSVSAGAAASDAAASTNTGAGTVTVLLGAISGVIGVSNLVAFTGGSDIESEDSRRLRFQAFISSLNRGTLTALRYGATTAALRDADGNITERAAHIGIIEPYEVDPVLNAPGFIEIYVHNGVGGTSPALIASVQQVIDGYYDENGAPVPGWKAAGVVVDCFAATEIVVPVTGVLTALPGYQVASLIDEAEIAIQSYVLSLPVGEKVIRAQIIEDVMSITGVYNFVPSLPATTEVAITKSQKAMPGVITVTSA